MNLPSTKLFQNSFIMNQTLQKLVYIKARYVFLLSNYETETKYLRDGDYIPEDHSV